MLDPLLFGGVQVITTNVLDIIVDVGAIGLSGIAEALIDTSDEIALNPTRFLASILKV